MSTQSAGRSTNPWKPVSPADPTPPKSAPIKKQDSWRPISSAPLAASSSSSQPSTNPWGPPSPEPNHDHNHAESSSRAYSHFVPVPIPVQPASKHELPRESTVMQDRGDFGFKPRRDPSPPDAFARRQRASPERGRIQGSRPFDEQRRDSRADRSPRPREELGSRDDRRPVDRYERDRRKGNGARHEEEDDRSWAAWHKRVESKSGAMDNRAGPRDRSRERVRERERDRDTDRGRDIELERTRGPPPLAQGTSAARGAYSNHNQRDIDRDRDRWREGRDAKDQDNRSNTNAAAWSAYRNARNDDARAPERRPNVDTRREPSDSWRREREPASDTGRGVTIARNGNDARDNWDRHRSASREPANRYEHRDFSGRGAIASPSPSNGTTRLPRRSPSPTPAQHDAPGSAARQPRMRSRSSSRSSYKASPPRRRQRNGQSRPSPDYSAPADPSVRRDSLPQADSDTRDGRRPRNAANEYDNRPQPRVSAQSPRRRSPSTHDRKRNLPSPRLPETKRTRALSPERHIEPDTFRRGRGRDSPTPRREWPRERERNRSPSPIRGGPRADGQHTSGVRPRRPSPDYGQQSQSTFSAAYRSRSPGAGPKSFPPRRRSPSPPSPRRRPLSPPDRRGRSVSRSPPLPYDKESEPLPGRSGSKVRQPTQSARAPLPPQNSLVPPAGDAHLSLASQFQEHRSDGQVWRRDEYRMEKIRNGSMPYARTSITPESRPVNLPISDLPPVNVQASKPSAYVPRVPAAQPLRSPRSPVPVSTAPAEQHTAALGALSGPQNSALPTSQRDRLAATEREYALHLDSIAPYIQAAFKEWYAQNATPELSAFLNHYFGRQPGEVELTQMEQLLALKTRLARDQEEIQVLHTESAKLKSIALEKRSSASPVIAEIHLAPPPLTHEVNTALPSSERSSEATAGKLTGDTYERLACVGEGTYGKVYKARNRFTNGFVAMKRIRMEGEKDGFPVTAMREIKLLQSLHHDNIIRLHEMMVSKGSVYMVFDYMEHDLVGVLSHPSITFTPANLKSLNHQMLSGLAYLHRRGVLHRDMKGSNILLDARGILKLADFGLARWYNRKRKADYTNRVITLWYRGPELLLGETAYGPEVDMWSAGCIMLEIATSKPVFQGNDEINQLDVIYAIMGTPNEVAWPGVKDLPWYELVKPKKEIKSTFRSAFTKWFSPEGLHLAEGLLTFDPIKRLSAAAALEMPYFTTEEPKMVTPTQLAGIGEHHEMSAKQERRRKIEGKQGKSTT